MGAPGSRHGTNRPSICRPSLSRPGTGRHGEVAMKAKVRVLSVLATTPRAGRCTGRAGNRIHLPVPVGSRAIPETDSVDPGSDRREL
jgi:hypothetical protein